MLTIILGSKDSEKFLKDSKYVDYNDGLFDDMYKKEWFNNKFVQEVLEKIDKIDIEKSNGVSFVNKRTGNMHSHKELSTGTKTLILMYKYPNVVFQARFGDNCNEFVEELAVKNNITIKADYFHSFRFRHITEINYINYGIIARNAKDLQKIYVQFIEDNRLKNELDTDATEDNRPLKERHPDFYDRLMALEEQSKNGNNTNN